MMNGDNELLDKDFSQTEDEPKEDLKTKKYSTIYIFLMIIIGMLVSKLLGITKVSEDGYYAELLGNALGIIIAGLGFAAIIEFIKFAYFKLVNRKKNHKYEFWFRLLESTFYCWSFIILIFLLLHYILELRL